MRKRFPQAPVLAIFRQANLHLGLWIGWLICLTGTCALPAAEEPRLDHVTHLTVEDGLADGLVRAVLQDRTGFLWFATIDGLQRYDGYELRTYRHDPDDPDSISASRVRAILEDRAGELWFATLGGGLNRLDRAQERFIRYQHDPEDPASLADNRLRALCEDHAGGLWVGAVGALHRFDRRTGRFTRFFYDPEDPGSLSPGAVHALLEDRQGRLWIGTERGLDRFEREGGVPEVGSFIHLRHDPDDPRSLSHDVVRALLEDRQGDLWVGTEGGLDRLTADGFHHVRHDQTEPPGQQPDLVRTIHEDRDGGLWVGTESGGLLYRAPDREIFARFRDDPENSYDLSSDAILDVHEDATGILWLATRVGIDKVDRRLERFEVIRPRGGGLSGRRIWGLAGGPDGSLWIGTRDGGLNRVAPDGRVRHYRHDPGDPRSLSNDDVADVAIGPSGEVWVGTAGGLDRFDAATGGFVRYRHDPRDPRSLRSDKIYSLLAASSGSLWIATRSDGVQRLDPPGEERPGETFTTYLHDPTDEHSLPADEAYGFYEDRAGDIWLGTVAGLGRFDRSSDGFERFPHEPENPDSLSHDDVTSIFEDPEGIFWLGTLGGGLNRWDRVRGEFRHYRRRDGLPSDNVFSILGDDRGYLWLAAGHGLTRFDPRTGQTRSYDSEDGLHGNAFEIGSAYRSREGKLYFGGPGGVTAFFPGELGDDRSAPAVVFTEFRLAGEPAPLRRRDPSSPLRESITLAGELTLTHRHKAVAFEFAALHFASPHRNLYTYRLEGFDDDWIPAAVDQRSARYTNLDPGSYVLRVKAANRDGLWNEDGASIRLRVLPPPWRTWWAWSLYGLGLSLVVVGYVRRQQGELRREREATERERRVSARLREVDRLKDDFLANTSHELRTPLYGITGLAESLIDGARGELPAPARRDLELLVSSGRRLAGLVDDILDFSKIRHQGLELDLRPVDLRSLTEVVLALSKPLVGTKDLALRNAVPDDLPAVVADEQRLFQILHNLVGNAVKFTESGAVTVQAEVVDREIRVAVRDTGIGIAEERQQKIFEAFEQADSSIEREYGGTGLGLAVTQQLVDLHGGRLSVSSELGKGATFHFTLPGTGRPASSSLAAASVRPLGGPPPPPPQEEPDPGGDRESPGPDAPRLLVVDDEQVIRRVLANQLVTGGYLCVQAASGAEALEKLAEERIDLVLLDVMMPRMSGYEACRQLRESFSMDELPVIFLTAKNRVEDLIVGLAAGANDYLPKPVSKNELLSRVKTHLALLAVHRQLTELVAERTGRLQEHERLLRERERLVDELQARNAELARFNYTVSHDLKNPLVTLKNFLGMLRRDAEAGHVESLEHHLGRLDNAAGQIESLLDGLFAFSSIGTQANPWRDVPFERLIEGAAQRLARQLTEQGVELVVAPDLPGVCGDPDLLGEAVFRLLDNAVRFLGEQPRPRIEVGCRQGAGEPVFYVRDNGEGIEPRYHELIFELFEQLDPAASEGTGIGLALARRIVEAHYGRIWVESQGRGLGSTFCFTLPRDAVRSQDPIKPDPAEELGLPPARRAGR